MGQGEEIKTRDEPNLHIQERGEIFFFYRPKVDKEEAHSADDVQRLYIVLRPESGDRAVEEKQSPDSGKEGSKKEGGHDKGGSSHKQVSEGGHGSQEVNIEKEPLLRFIVMGRKTLPDPGKRSRPYWGFVEMVTTKIEDVKTALEGAMLGIRYYRPQILSTKLNYKVLNIEKIRKRINSWKNKFLTYAGRVILIKSVLCSMQVYWTACFILPKRTMKTINCIFRSFLWSGDDTPTKKAMVNWKSVCKPFKEGGLGIRNIEVSNISACLKHIWHLVSSKDSIWARWVHRNLIKQRDFWIMKAPTDTSWCWKHILECRVQAAGLIHFSIGDGQNIKFWKDPWHPLGILIDKFPQELLYDSLLHKEARVGALIRNGMWCVPPHIEPSVADITSQLDAVEVDSENLDEVVWRAGPNGTYSLKHTYEALRPRSNVVPWAKLVWFKGNVPRHSFITWTLTHYALKTMYKLKKWGMAQHDLCFLCTQEAESEDHLFFVCSYSQQVWTQILRYLCYNRQVLQWNQELVWCSQAFAGNDPISTVKKLALNASIYHLWAERNRRAHENTRLLAPQLVQRIYDDVRIKLAGLNLKIEDNARNREVFNRWRTDPTFFHKHPIKCTWTNPPAGWHKVNSDGSLRGTRGGYGAIVRNEHGEVVTACAGSATGHSVIKHELQGVDAGLIAAALHEVKKLEVTTDSRNVHDYLTKDMAVPWYLRHIVARIRRALNQLEEYRVVHQFRETNRAADHLAGLYPSSEFFIVIESSFAEDLKKIVYEDKIGKEYEQEYDTATRGHKHQPPARALGEGIYRILKHNFGKKKTHTHLIYKLEFPPEGEKSEPQDELNVEREGSFFIQIKNPDQHGSSSESRFRGLQNKRKAVFPARLQGQFGSLRYSPADPPDFLNYEGCEFLLISASDDIDEELGIELKGEQGEAIDASCSDLVRTFGETASTSPLLKGTWA